MYAKLLEEYSVTLRQLASCCYSLYEEFQLLWVTHVEAQVVLETASAALSLLRWRISPGMGLRTQGGSVVAGVKNKWQCFHVKWLETL